MSFSPSIYVNFEPPHQPRGLSPTSITSRPVQAVAHRPKALPAPPELVGSAPEPAVRLPHRPLRQRLGEARPLAQAEEAEPRSRATRRSPPRPRGVSSPPNWGGFGGGLWVVLVWVLVALEKFGRARCFRLASKPQVRKEHADWFTWTLHGLVGN